MTTDADKPAASGQRRFGVVLNPGSGDNPGHSPDALLARATRALAPHGHVVRAVSVVGDDLPEAFRRMADAGDIDVLVAIGGDGTVACGAGAALAAGKTFLPLPFGTFNLFCRSLGHTTAGVASLDELGDLAERDIRVGTINGQTFITHVSGGMQPRFVRLREQIPYASRAGKVRAAVAAWLRTIRSLPRYATIIEAGKTRHRRRVAGYAVMPGALREDVTAPLTIDLGADADLVLHLTSVRRPVDAFLLTLALFAGAWRGSRLVETFAGPAFTLHLKTDHVELSVDGERRVVATPLVFALADTRLRVLAPARGPQRP